MQIYRKNMTMHGFIVFNIFPKHEDEFYRTVPLDIAEGRLK
jgi:NADPH-dependent curcumin reductase CurA